MKGPKQVQVDVEVMRKAYSSSKALVDVCSSSLQDAADILQVLLRWVVCKSQSKSDHKFLFSVCL